MNIIRSIFAALILVVSVTAQNNERPRIYVRESESWEMSGGIKIGLDGFKRWGKGGARPQTAEIVKTFNERCPICIVTKKEDKADYVVILEHEGGKSALRRDNKFALFNKEGDAIRSGSTLSLGGAVKDACEALMEDWKSRQTTNQRPEQKSNN